MSNKLQDTTTVSGLEAPCFRFNSLFAPRSEIVYLRSSLFRMSSKHRRSELTQDGSSSCWKTVFVVRHALHLSWLHPSIQQAASRHFRRGPKRHLHCSELGSAGDHATIARTVGEDRRIFSLTQNHWRTSVPGL